MIETEEKHTTTNLCNDNFFLKYGQTQTVRDDAFSL